MKRILTLLAACLALGAWAQGVSPLPTLHTEGRWLVDKHGNQVVLHGVMDTPSNYFNGGRWEGSKALGWWDHYNDTGAANCLAYFEKLFDGMQQAKCDVFRLHMDPAWTNDPDESYVYPGSKGQSSDATGEASISRFNPARYDKFLPQVYLKLAEMAMNHGMYVVVRPPGVCPRDLKVGDYYNDYLLYIWDIFSQQDFVKQHAGQISIELANEPVNLKNAQNQEDTKALHDYFQPIVNKIRQNGFTGIIWAPGTGWQGNYTSYAEHPIEGDNIGYAVHDYCGWYGCSDDTPDPQNKIEQFHSLVPVVDFAPVIITEVDWSPKKPGAGHYNEHGDWVEANYGTWATGSTSKWGKAYKTMLDHFGNISMTLSGTGCLLDIDKLLSTSTAYPAFDGLEEACGKACMDWYADYYKVNWPHADDEAETGDFYTAVSLSAAHDSYDLMIGDNTPLSLKLAYSDGHTKDVSDVATYTVDNPAVAEVKFGYLKALTSGDAVVTASYTDAQGKAWQQSFSVKVTGLSLGDFTALGSLSEITSQPFAMVSKDSQKMFYSSTAQNLGYDEALTVINDKSINGYMFVAEPISGRSGCYLLKSLLLNGNDYIMWTGKPGYLNSQAADQWCCFILGLENQYGQDIKDGAVWEIKHEEGKGFSLKNMGTGKYLRDAAPAKYDAPAYIDFLKAGGTTDIQAIRKAAGHNAIYTLQGQKIATTSQWSTLPRGIYIINGKKVVR